VAGLLARRGVRGPVASAAHVRAVTARPERLERAGLDLTGFVPLDGVHAVVPAVEQEGVIQAFGGEETLLLGDPFLQATMRHDLEWHVLLLELGPLPA
jgi:hypothetical protein